MNENAYEDVKRRELRRFHHAVDSVIEGLLLKKYEETRNAEEYRDYSRICNLVKSNLHVLDLLAGRMNVLFERTGERSNWEIYLTGLRKMARKMPDSYLYRFVLPMLGLEPLREKVSAYSGRCLEQFHAAHKTLQEVDTYLANLTVGQSIAREYQSERSDLPRLYSSAKTWDSQSDFEGFFRGLEEFLDLTVEVFVVGPVQLYLMIGKDTFLAIFKALSVGKLSELHDNGREHLEVLQLHDFVYGAVADSKILAVSREVMQQAVREYSKRLRAEHERLRAQLPTRELRRRFIGRYESGALFQPETD